MRAGGIPTIISFCILKDRPPPSPRYLSLVPSEALSGWLEPLKAAWVSGDPLRRNAKSNVSVTLAQMFQGAASS